MSIAFDGANSSPRLAARWQRGRSQRARSRATACGEIGVLVAVDGPEEKLRLSAVTQALSDLRGRNPADHGEHCCVRCNGAVVAFGV
jgi:hypothetical protein